MGLTNFPNGITSFGCPVLPAAMPNVQTGSVFFVKSGSGADNTGQGKDPNNPFATVDYAIGQCTASKGDTIYVMPGHTETLAAAGNIALLDVAGVNVIGIGVGDLIPTLNLNHADATFNVTAANCRVSNIKFISGAADVKVGVTLAATSDGSTIDNCVFRDTSANVEFLVGISVAAAAHSIKILYNDFKTTIAAGSNNAILTAAVTDLNVIGNVAYGKYATGAMLGSAALTRAVIADNVFTNAEAAIGLALHTSSTGVVVRNLVGGTTSIAAALTGMNAMTCLENYVTGDVARSGIIIPAVDAD